MFRYPKVAFTTEKGCSGGVCAIRWLPSLLPHRVVLAVHPRRDSPACSAYCVFPLSARRRTLPYSGEMNSTLVPVNPKQCGGMTTYTRTLPVLLISVFMKLNCSFPYLRIYHRNSAEFTCTPVADVRIWPLHGSPFQINSEGVLSEWVLGGSGKS